MSVGCDVRLNAARHGEELCLLICHVVAVFCRSNMESGAEQSQLDLHEGEM